MEATQFADGNKSTTSWSQASRTSMIETIKFVWDCQLINFDKQHTSCHIVSIIQSKRGPISRAVCVELWVCTARIVVELQDCWPCTEKREVTERGRPIAVMSCWKSARAYTKSSKLWIRLTSLMLSGTTESYVPSVSLDF